MIREILKNNQWIIGIDEAGRGPLAGPVAVGLYAVKDTVDQLFLKGIRDSKKLSEKKREEWFQILQKCPSDDVISKVVLVSAKEIDNHGISVVIRTAIEKLLHDFPDNAIILLDGTLRAPGRFENQTTIIQGDDKEPLISAASICAKVTRDAYMKKISSNYPRYEFDRHKGYGTNVHRDAIEKYGVCEEHRITYLKNIMARRP